MFKYIGTRLLLDISVILMNVAGIMMLYSTGETALHFYIMYSMAIGYFISELINDSIRYLKHKAEELK